MSRYSALSWKGLGPLWAVGSSTAGEVLKQVPRDTKGQLSFTSTARRSQENFTCSVRTSLLGGIEVPGERVAEGRRGVEVGGLLCPLWMCHSTGVSVCSLPGSSPNPVGEGFGGGSMTQRRWIIALATGNQLCLCLFPPKGGPKVPS